MNVKRVALVGSSSTGKTTVYELLRNRLPKWEFINESTRTVMRYGYPINEQGTDETQLAILAFHLSALLKPYNLVLDRCLVDTLVYSRITDVHQRTIQYVQDQFEEVIDEYTHVVYFPIEFAAVADGERSVDEGWRKRADDEFVNCLDNYYKDKYLTVTGSPMQRVNQILKYIEH
jgi:nicotinamide riboside kinase